MYRELNIQSDNNTSSLTHCPVTEMEAPTKAKEQLKYLAEASEVFESSLGLTFKKVKGKTWKKVIFILE